MINPLLIITGNNLIPREATSDFTLDLAWGESENDFSLTVLDRTIKVYKKLFIWLDGTPFGGIVDSVEPTRKNGVTTVVYEGRTFSGIMGSRILTPPAGRDYLTVSGQPHQILRTLLDNAGLAGLFTVEAGADLEILYQVDRYTDLWTCIIKICQQYQLSPVFRCAHNQIYVSLKKSKQWDEENNPGMLDYTIKDKTPPNHLIVGGKGDLQAREIIHLYADQAGNVSDVQQITGLDEITQFYDDNNAEGQELRDNGVKKLKELQNVNSIVLTINSLDSMSIGDTVAGYDEVTGTSISSRISKQILKISKGVATVTCEATKK